MKDLGRPGHHRRQRLGAAHRPHWPAVQASEQSPRLAAAEYVRAKAGVLGIADAALDRAAEPVTYTEPRADNEAVDLAESRVCLTDRLICSTSRLIMRSWPVFAGSLRAASWSPD